MLHDYIKLSLAITCVLHYKLKGLAF